MPSMLLCSMTFSNASRGWTNGRRRLPHRLRGRVVPGDSNMDTVSDDVPRAQRSSSLIESRRLFNQRRRSVSRRSYGALVLTGPFGLRTARSTRWGHPMEGGQHASASCRVSRSMRAISPNASLSPDSPNSLLPTPTPDASPQLTGRTYPATVLPSAHPTPAHPPPARLHSAADPAVPTQR